MAKGEGFLIASAIFFVGSSTLSEKTFLDERMTMIISPEENAKLFCTYLLYNHSGCKRALQSVVLLKLEKNRKRHNDVFTARKGFEPPVSLAAFSMHKYFDQIVRDLTNKFIEVKNGFWYILAAKMA